MAESLIRSKNQLNPIHKLFATLDDTRDTKQFHLLELPFVIFCFSVEDDYQRNIYVTVAVNFWFQLIL